MTLVLLIRHGINEWVKSNRAPGRTPGIHLNDEGKAQAQGLVERLKALPIKAIYASPLERAVETAQPLCEATGLPLQTRDGLMDADAGEWTGRLYKELTSTPTWRSLQTYPRGTRLPGGETIDEVQERMVAEIEAIRRDNPQQIVAVVSHADPIKTVVAYYLGLDLDHFQKLAISPASVTALAISEHGAMLLVLNDTGSPLALPAEMAEQRERKLVRRISWPEEEQRMARVTYDMHDIRRITASAVGLPGQRTFYIQAEDDSQTVTVLCEKEQVAALAIGINQLLEELDESHPQTTAAVEPPAEEFKLQEPLEPVFRAGQLGLGYDEKADAIVLIAYEQPESEDVDIETLSVARFWADRGRMKALTRYAEEIVAAGRPLCPLCNEPMDPSGHICAKKNGHKQIEAT